ncbi:MAG TPA: redox-regulated ATPase YchF [Patescibacteria group bacterium]|nr:redox-regulated ATPase YchF [Patescibacteria group bacterium]
MSLSLGIVGLPNAGKSTLFNALLSRQMAKVESFPFTTIEPNVGIVPVPDERLERLSQLIKPQTTTPASVEFIDIAGLIKGAHKGEGLGNQFLGKIREVAAIVHIVRMFTNPDVSHYYETIDPRRDIEIVNIELQLGGIKKPTIYVLNVSEDQLKDQKWPSRIKVGEEEVELVPVCAKLEADLADFSSEERKQYLKEMGIEESGLDKLIKKAYQLLGLITFYTIKGGKEVRAWSLQKGKTSLDAAGEVHTDMAKGFVKAEVVGFEELVESGGWKGAAETGKVRLEGRDYFVKEGDIIEFKFNA